MKIGTETCEAVVDRENFILDVGLAPHLKCICGMSDVHKECAYREIVPLYTLVWGSPRLAPINNGRTAIQQLVLMLKKERLSEYQL